VSVDLAISITLLVTALAVAAAYAVRLARRGRARSARVDREGSSALLGQAAMEGGTWAMAPIARALAAAGVTPNAITGASLALSLAAGVALGLGRFGVAAAIAAVAAMGDALDGAVARATGTASDAGEVFDAAVDRYAEFAFLAGLAVHYRGEAALLSLALAALLASFMVSYSTAKAEALHVVPPRGAMRRAERAVYLTSGALLTPIAGALVARTGLVAPWLGEAPMIGALALVAVVGNVSAAQRLFALFSSVRERDRSRAPSAARAPEPPVASSEPAPELAAGPHPSR
jgi:CDP-diacylglycerol--glycerol-3-phosphate 3-phosphatidyltransferase